MTNSSANQLVLQAKFALALKLGILTSLSIQGKENMYNEKTPQKASLVLWTWKICNVVFHDYCFVLCVVSFAAIHQCISSMKDSAEY